MTSVKELYQDMEFQALRASRNLHKDFTRYLCGLTTWDEFIQMCKDREAKFESGMKSKTKK